jgi:hypothetical protein
MWASGLCSTDWLVKGWHCANRLLPYEHQFQAHSRSAVWAEDFLQLPHAQQAAADAVDKARSEWLGAKAATARAWLLCC